MDMICTGPYLYHFGPDPYVLNDVSRSDHPCLLYKGDPFPLPVACLMSERSERSEGVENLEGGPLGTPSIPLPSKSKEVLLETKSFLLTVSVPGDISEGCIKQLVSYIKKATIHAYVVTELGESDRLHLHAVLVYKDPMLARKIRENVWDRFIKKHHPDAKGSIAVKVQVCPGHKWYDEYLQKEGSKTVHLDTYDREKVTDYFPTIAVQEALQTKSAISRSAAPHITRDVELWAQSVFENNCVGALNYLKHRMFVLRDMIPISDKRKLCDKAYMYYEYRNGIVVATSNELRLLGMNDAVFDFGPLR